MPAKPARPCPRCRARMEGETCERCGKSTKRDQKAYDELRGSASERGYNHAWNVFAADYKRRHPLCADCEDKGLTVAVEEVDHVIPLSERPDLKFDERNLRGRCKPCHVRKTWQDRKR